MEVLEFYRRATDEFDRRANAVPDDRWDSATPCTEWDVRALVNHVVNEDLWVAPLLEGKTIADVGDSLDGDLLGDDPKGAWASARDEALRAAAAAQPTTTVHVSYGDIPAEQYLKEVAVDHVIHAWDLARAIGADEGLDPELVEEARAVLAPVADQLAGSGAYGEMVRLPADADAQSKLLAMTGRDPRAG